MINTTVLVTINHHDPFEAFIKDKLLVPKEVRVTLPSGKGGVISSGTTAVSVTNYLVMRKTDHKLFIVSPDKIKLTT